MQTDNKPSKLWRPPDAVNIEDVQLRHIVELVMHKLDTRTTVQRLRREWGLPAEGFPMTLVGAEFREPPKWAQLDKLYAQDQQFFGYEGFRELYRAHEGLLAPFYEEIAALRSRLQLTAAWKDFIVGLVVFNSTEYIPNRNSFQPLLLHADWEFDGSYEVSRGSDEVILKVKSWMSAEALIKAVRRDLVPLVSLLPKPSMGSGTDVALHSQIADLAREFQSATWNIERDDLVAQIDIALSENGLDLNPANIVKKLERARKLGL